MQLKVGVVGSFHPVYDFTGNTTTPIAFGLARNDLVEQVNVFCQSGGFIPTGFDKDHVRVFPCWRHNDPLSIAGALGFIHRASRGLSLLLFNMYVTAYGHDAMANAAGLLLPSILSRAFRIPTVVYMHNFLETQDAERLGYNPSQAVRLGVHGLEWLLLRSTEVLVPLGDQATKIQASFGVRPKSILIPFLESYLPMLERINLPPSSDAKSGRPFRILLMGSWGPQKDLSGALNALSTIAQEGIEFELTITGTSNPHFPNYLSEFDIDSIGGLSGRARYTGAVSDEDLLGLVMHHDLLLLPYNATGGYSGAMNFAAITGIPMVAYEHSQLREQAAKIGANVTFVKPVDLADGIRKNST